MSEIQPVNEERLLKIILGPQISEKASMVTEKNNQYVFKVAPTATKVEIKQAVQHLFKVSVESVQVLNLKGKQKRFRQQLGRRNDIKKAYVRLKEGHQISFMSKE